MTQFVFSIPTQIHFGPGVSTQAGPVLKGLVATEVRPAAGVLAIVDPGIEQAAWLKDILASLTASGLPAHVFDEVKPNPREEDVVRAAAAIREKDCAAVLAVGGGSTLDTAKAAALLASHGGGVGDYAGWARVPGPVLPVVAVPTTAGSGSEATCWAVITDGRSHAKLAIGDRHLAPAAALVDPNLTLSLPARLTAATGMDVLTHAIEAYLSALSNPVNDLLALEAIRLVAVHLPAAVKEGADAAARAGMMLASTLGGIAINNADVAGVHCLSEGMGSLYDAPHGLMNAILLPYFMAFWQAGCRERFTHIAEAFGAGANPEQAAIRVEALNRAFEFPGLADLGVRQADLQRLAESAEANVSNTSNPVPMAAKDYLGLLEQALAGRPSKAG